MTNSRDYERWKEWNRDAFGTFSALDAAYFLAEFKRAGIELQSWRGTVFELGFGNGSLAGFLQSLGIDYLGAEASRELVHRAAACGFKASLVSEDAGSFDGIQSSSIDVIVAFDVLEHLALPDIERFLQRARNVLRPKGILLVRMPSGDSPFGRAVFHGDVTHRTNLGSSVVQQLAVAHDYDLLYVEPPCLPIFGLGMARALRRTAIRVAQKLIASVVNYVFHEGRRCVITANMVFAMQRR